MGRRRLERNARQKKQLKQRYPSKLPEIKTERVPKIGIDKRQERNNEKERTEIK